MARLGGVYDESGLAFQHEQLPGLYLLWLAFQHKQPLHAIGATGQHLQPSAVDGEHA